MRNLIRSLILLVILISASETLDFNYHKHKALTSFLKNFTEHHSDISSKLLSIGKSVRGRDLWVVEITAAAGSKIGIPNVKLIGNIHGNEAAGREILLHFMEYLASNYGTDPTITWLMENTRIHILPSMNPDGFEISNEGICSGEYGRCNSKHMDLNRNFPDFFSKNPYPTQPEAAAIQKWMKNVSFILSASLHGGALVANYPFDTVKEMTSLPINPPSISPDDDVFIHLAKVYANRHPTMHLGLACPESVNNFTGGITNGAAWYPFMGGMQDYNYAFHGCMELTLEISCCKYPHSRELPKLWEANKYALLDLIKQAHRGVKGIIFDSQSLQPVGRAVLKISGREMNFTSTKNGEFWRILLPGTYKLEINAKGYHSEIVSFEVLDYGQTQSKLTPLHIPLTNETFPRPTPSTTTTQTVPNLSVRFSSNTESHVTKHSDEQEEEEEEEEEQQQQRNYSEHARDQSKNEKDTPIHLRSTGERIGSSNLDYSDASGGATKWSLSFCELFMWILTALLTWRM